MISDIGAKELLDYVLDGEEDEEDGLLLVD
jgi:hypothetical protein